MRLCLNDLAVNEGRRLPLLGNHTREAAHQFLNDFTVQRFRLADLLSDNELARLQPFLAQPLHRGVGEEEADAGAFGARRDEGASGGEMEVIAGREQHLRAMGENIETAIREGLIKPHDVDLLTLTLWGITHGYASLAVSFPVIPMAALEAAQGTAVRAMATEIFTADGLAAWRAAQASEGGETGPEGRATRS